MSDDSEIKGEFPFSELVKRQQRQRRGRGRPLKGVRRDPTTVYLTEAERETLGRLQVDLGRYFSANRSELVGVSIALLAELVDIAVSSNSLSTNDLDTFHAWVMSHVDFIKSKNQKITGRGKKGSRP